MLVLSETFSLLFSTNPLVKIVYFFQQSLKLFYFVSCLNYYFQIRHDDLSIFGLMWTRTLLINMTENQKLPQKCPLHIINDILYYSKPVLFPTFLEKRFGGHAFDCEFRLPQLMTPVILAETSVGPDCDELVLHPCTQNIISGKLCSKCLLSTLPLFLSTIC